MNNFTYEKEDRSQQLETYEWDNVWWEQASDTKKPRVLYIGDSISCGIRQIATRLSGNQILFDGFGTSKAVDNPYFADSIRLFGNQQGHREIVIFNNGLHGFHLDDASEYKEGYEKIVKFLLEEYRGTKLALILTTCVIGERNNRVTARNNSVKEIAQKYGLPVIDLYSVSMGCSGLHWDDGVHFYDEGYERLAHRLLESLYEMIPEAQSE